MKATSEDGDVDDNFDHNHHGDVKWGDDNANNDDGNAGNNFGEDDDE